MRKIDSNKSILNRYLHGYILAKNHYNGKLKREIFVTVYCPGNQESSYGYLFLCERNAMLFVQKLNNESNVLWEFKKDDVIIGVPGDDTTVTQMLNQTSSSERNLTVTAKRPVTYIQLNNDYIILCNIQADLAIGGKIINFKTTYFTPTNYQEKVDNLISVLHQITRKEKVLWNKSLPGIEGKLAIVNIYLVGTVFVLFIIFISLLPLLIGLKVGLLCWAIVLVILWQIKK